MDRNDNCKDKSLYFIIYYFYCFVHTIAFRLQFKYVFVLRIRLEKIAAGLQEAIQDKTSAHEPPQMSMVVTNLIRKSLL